MADQIYADGPITAPAKYKVPGSSVIVPIAVQAVLDGNNASGDFVPTLIFRSQAGHVIARVPTDTTVVAGGSAEVSWFPGVKHAASAAPPPASSGLVVANLYQSGFGPTYPTSLSDVYAFDTAYASPSSDTTDFTVLDIDTTTAFNGNPVWGIKVNAAGTYMFFGTWNVRATDVGVTNVLLSWASTGGVGPSTFFQGRYGTSPADTWQNTATGAGTGELFLHQWFLARAGHTGFFVTLDTVIQGTGNVIANPSIYAVQLSPTALSGIV